MVSVEQNAIKRAPRVTFINGYNLERFSRSDTYRLRYSDKHLVGENNPREQKREEFLTFIEIKEVSFFRGSHFSED